MASTYTLIERITVTANGAGTVSFNSIPQNYTDLVIKVSARTLYSGGADGYFFFQDGSATTNYNWKKLQGTGTGTSSYGATGVGTIAGLTLKGDASLNAFSNIEIYIPNYTSSNYKSTSSNVTSENNGAAGYTDIVAGMWTNTSAITSITFSVAVGWAYNSTFSLYGISNASTTITGQGFPYATGGDIIQTDGTYWYHAFLTSGTFTPQKNNLSCDILTVAGGGGGGGHQLNDKGGGGGGAGGLIYGAATVLTANQSYTVTIGAGGAGGGTGSTAATSRGANGNDSTFGSILFNAYGGGGGAGGWQTSTSDHYGYDGGSGGGATKGGVGGASLGGQGNAGGTVVDNGNEGGGGGGGYASAGQSFTGSGATIGGTGGNGTGTYSSMILPVGLGYNSSGTYYVAGGGGGGAYSGSGGSGGLGGAGNGGASGSSGTNAAGNTGSGGGGAGGGANAARSGSNGASGFVVVRYAI